MIETYCGPPPTPGALASDWNFDPVLLGVLGLSFAVLAFRSRDRRQRVWLIVALIAAVVAFVSPLCALSVSLFAARTVHHVLILSVLAPALAAAAPSAPRRSRVGVAALLQAVVLWVWHAPAAYQAALSDTGVYWLMQVSLLASAVWFWRELRRASTPAAVFGLLLTTVQMGLLGALLLFSGQALYAPHLVTTQAWGLGPLEDQQLAGLIMWAPAGGLYLAAALFRLGRWLGPDRSAAAA